MKSNGMKSNGMKSNGMKSNGMKSNGMKKPEKYVRHWTWKWLLIWRCQVWYILQYSLSGIRNQSCTNSNRVAICVSRPQLFCQWRRSNRSGWDSAETTLEKFSWMRPASILLTLITSCIRLRKFLRLSSTIYLTYFVHVGEAHQSDSNGRKFLPCSVGVGFCCISQICTRGE